MKFIFGILLIASSAYAMPSRNDLAIEYVRLTSGDLLNPQAFSRLVRAGMNQQLSSEAKTKYTEKDLDAFVDSIDFQEFEQGVAQVYVDNFNESELSALIQFTKSPIGQKISKKQFELAKSTTEFISQWTQSTVAKFVEKSRKKNP